MGWAYFTHSGEWKLVLCFDVKNPWGGGKKKLCRQDNGEKALQQTGWQTMDCGHVTRDVGRWLDTLNVLVPSSIWNTTALGSLVTILLKDSGLTRRKE